MSSESLFERPGLMLILSAPSGAGKTTLAHALLDGLAGEGLFSISYTTRAPRGQERDGEDYWFVDAPRFKEMAEQGEFLEWAEVHGQWYGSHLRYFEESRRGKVVLFDIDVQGGRAIKERHPEAVSVFILPPSMEELRRRLCGRGTDQPEVIERRMLAARSEMVRGLDSYDYVVVNHELTRSLRELDSIVRAERCRRSRLSRNSLAGLGLAPTQR